MATFCTCTLSHPLSTGECGSPSTSVKAWCLRCTATHWRGRVPVVIHTRHRNTWSTTGFKVNARCDRQRCRYTVVHTLARTETPAPMASATRIVCSIGARVPATTYWSVGRVRYRGGRGHRASRREAARARHPHDRRGDPRGGRDLLRDDRLRGHL